jgi:hypothetical protein
VFFLCCFAIADSADRLDLLDSLVIRWLIPVGRIDLVARARRNVTIHLIVRTNLADDSQTLRVDCIIRQSLRSSSGGSVNRVTSRCLRMVGGTTRA